MTTQQAKENLVKVCLEVGLSKEDLKKVERIDSDGRNLKITVKPG